MIKDRQKELGFLLLRIDCTAGITSRWAVMDGAKTLGNVFSITIQDDTKYGLRAGWTRTAWFCFTHNNLHYDHSPKVYKAINRKHAVLRVITAYHLIPRIKIEPDSVLEQMYKNYNLDILDPRD